VAVLMLTHVNYRTGAMHDMAAVTAAAHAAGSPRVGPGPQRRGRAGGPEWVPGADFAVGCGYKYLNGGPGAPAFVWVKPPPCRPLLATAVGLVGPCSALCLHTRLPARPGITRYLCGTQPILSLTALECGLDTCWPRSRWAAWPHCAPEVLALTDLFIALVEQRCRAWPGSGHPA
jgi:kynureninase